MNYACLSCGAKYSIPDTRVQKAGADGLRVRCSRCRAIMAVSPTMAKKHRSDDSMSSPANDVFARTGGVSPHQPSTPLVTGVMKNPFADVAAPASFSSSGGLQSSSGVSREVTGIFMGMLASVEGGIEGLDGLELESGVESDTSSAPTKKKSAVFYAAIEGRARGPYSAKEMLMLAEKGKIRAGTLLWKPGASGWKPLKHVEDFDVAFLLDAVRTRKRREREAELLAERKLGITPVRLERQTVRPLRSAPALPFDAFFDDADAGNTSLTAPANWQASLPPTSTKPRVRAPFLMAAAFAGGVVAVVAVLFALSALGLVGPLRDVAFPF